MGLEHRLPTQVAWSAHEHDHYEKTPDWYWGLGLLVLVLTIGAIFFNNVLLAILILLGGVMVGVYASRHPDRYEFALTPRGVIIHNKLYPYKTLESFWIDDIHPHATPKLLLKSTKTFMPLIVVPLEDVDLELIHVYLNRHLPEVEKAEPLAHKLFELVGF